MFRKWIVALILVFMLFVTAANAKNLHLKAGFSVLTYGFTLGGELDIDKFHVEAGGFGGLVDEGFYLHLTRSIAGDYLKIGGVYKSLTTHDELLTFGLADEETDYNVIGGIVEISIFRSFFLKPYLRGEIMNYSPADEGPDDFTAFNVAFGISI